MKFLVLIMFIISSSISVIKSDIPVHCLSHQITGNWVFYQTETEEKTLPELYKHKCGISDHTYVQDIMNPKINKKDYKNKFEIKFEDNHKAIITSYFKEFKGSKV